MLKFKKLRRLNFQKCSFHQFIHEFTIKIKNNHKNVKVQKIKIFKNAIINFKNYLFSSIYP